MEPVVRLELTSVQEEDRQTAWRLFGELGDRYLKPVLQKLYSEEDIRNMEIDRVYEWLRLLRIRYRRAEGGGALINGAAAG